MLELFVVGVSFVLFLCVVVVCVTELMGGYDD